MGAAAQTALPGREADLAWEAGSCEGRSASVVCAGPAGSCGFGGGGPLGPLLVVGPAEARGWCARKAGEGKNRGEAHLKSLGLEALGPGPSTMPVEVLGGAGASPA